MAGRLQGGEAVRHPEVIDLLRAGRISVSGLVSIAPHVDDCPGLLEKCLGKSSREIDALVAGERPDPLSPRGEMRVKQVGPDTYKLEVVVSREQLEKIEAARGLCRHRNPRGDVAELIEQAMDVLIAKVEREKFSVGVRPQTIRREAKTVVPAAVRREVYERDGGRCAWMGEDGRRCGSREFLEYDHVLPLAEGGPSTVENGRLLCEAHNKLAARRVLGAARVEAAMGLRTRQEPTTSPSVVIRPGRCETGLRGGYK